MADQSVVIRFRALYDSKLGGLDRDMNRMASSAQAASAKAGAGLNSLARFSTIAGTALMVGVGAALAVGIKAAIDFESSFAGVRKTLDASEPQFMALASTIREMAKEIPLSVHELNKIAELGGQLGIPIGALEEFTEVIAKLGVTTNLEIEEAATALARIANVMGTSSDDFDNMGSTIVDLGNNFATTEQEIVNFSLRLSGIGATVGLSEQEVLGLATAFTSLGEPAERGATALQRIFIAMGNFASSGGPKLELIATLMGLTADAAADLIKSDPDQAFLAFERGLGAVISSGGDAAGILKELGLGAVRNTTLLLKGAAGVDVLAAALDNSVRAWDENIAMEEEAEKRFQTVASQLKLVGNAFTDFRIQLGEGVLPVVKDVIKFFGGLFGVMSDNMGVLKAMAIAVAVLAGVRGIGFLVRTVGSAVTAMVGFRAALSQAVLMSGSGFGAFRTAATAVGGLGSVLGVAAIALGAVAIGMANARARTNEMNAAVSTMVDNLQKLREETGPGGELTNQTIDDVLVAVEKATAGALFRDLSTDEIRGFLADLGMPLSQFTEMVVSSGDEFETWAETVLENAQAAYTAFGDPRNLTGEEFQAQQRAMRNLADMQELIAQARQIRGEIIQELRLREREAQLEAPSSRHALHAEQMKAKAQRQIAEEFAAASGPVGGLIGSIARILGEEEDKAEGILEKFVANVSEFSDEWNDAWADLVSGFQDEFKGWETTWEDYEKVPRISIAKFKKQMRIWNKDQERLLEANRMIAQNFSFDQQSLWNSLPEALRRGAAATLAESGPDAFMDLVDEFFLNMQLGLDRGGETAELNMPARAFDALTNQWPLALASAMEELPEELRENAQAQTAAYQLAWEQFLVDNPWIEPYIAEFAGGALEAFRESNDIIAPANWLDMTSAEKLEWLRSQGFDMAMAIALGFDMADLTFLFSEKLSSAARAAVRAAKGQFQAESPSRVFIGIGESVGQGFAIGLDRTWPAAHDVFGDFKMAAMRMPAQIPAPQVTVDGSGGGPTINFNGDVSDKDMVIRSVQKGTALAGLVRIAETAPGNG